jgi:hypothetical protein
MNHIEIKFANRESRMKSKIKVNKTVARIHSDKLEYFDKLHTVILKEKELQLIKTPNDTILQKEIKDIKNKKEEMEYYLDTSDILMNLENIESENHSITEYNEYKKELINEYFNITDTSLKDRPEADAHCTGCSMDLSKTANEYNSCSNCGVVIDRVHVSTTLGFNEKKDVTMKVAVHYKRINYFTEWLNQIQAKETTEIPNDLKNLLLSEIAKENIMDMRKLTIPMIKRFLKKCGKTKYYEHSPLIISELNGLPPLQIPIQIEEMFKFMFKEIQEPWSKFKDPEKTNIFSYPYTLYKFSQILDMPSILHYFPLLKSRDKLYTHDIIWKKIMIYLAEKNKIDTDNKPYDINWRFIPTV